MYRSGTSKALRPTNSTIVSGWIIRFAPSGDAALHSEFYLSLLEYTSISIDIATTPSILLRGYRIFHPLTTVQGTCPKFVYKLRRSSPAHEADDLVEACHPLNNSYRFHVHLRDAWFHSTRVRISTQPSVQFSELSPEPLIPSAVTLLLSLRLKRPSVHHHHTAWVVRMV